MLDIAGGVFGVFVVNVSDFYLFGGSRSTSEELLALLNDEFPHKNFGRGWKVVRRNSLGKK